MAALCCLESFLSFFPSFGFHRFPSGAGGGFSTKSRGVDCRGQVIRLALEISKGLELIDRELTDS